MRAIAAFAAAAFAVVCCAGLPLVAGTVGGLSGVALLGAGGGVFAIAAVALATALAVRVRGRPRRTGAGL